MEAFSDLVFGFSLSLLATRLDVPAKMTDIFDSARWLAIIGTFGLVCRFWLEHYRIFRHHFVAEMLDAVVNFAFLFGIAVLPYAVQTFLRFKAVPAFTLYVGDFSLLLATLAVLRVRSLRQRRDDPDFADRLREWRRSLTQLFIALFMTGMLIPLSRKSATLASALGDLDWYILGGFAAIILLARVGVRRLPAFLAYPARAAPR
ncbi:MAG TPA: TMEM175 family protein [Chthoniobacterales bacterium]